MDKKETFGAEIAKQLPIKDIYQDLAHPALSEVGQALQGATRVALAPITALVWGYDKIAGYLDTAVPLYFERKKIKPENIVSPDPAVAVPLIEAMRYTSHKAELREMFVNLLGASMNSACIDEHPSFVEIIKQLSSDECKMLQALRTDDRRPMMKIRQELAGGGELDVTPYFSDICYEANCQFPQKFPEYKDNLYRLGLIEVYYDRHLADGSYYQDLKNHPAYPQVIADDSIKLVERRSMYVLSEFGKKFCGVCME